MAHALDFTRGKAAIAYRGDIPWHGYGETISDNDSLETMMKKASLDWSILELDAFYSFNDQLVKVPNRKTLVRSDNGAWFSHMSENKYEVRQPKQIVEFFRDLCDHGGYQIETLGALFDGKKVWCLAKRKGKDAVGNIGDDIINPYILLADSYDGSMATTAQATSIRVVCNNTLSYSVNSKQGAKIKVGHHQKFDADKVKAQLGEADKGFADYLATMKKFSEVKMSDEFRGRFFMKLFGNATTEAKKEEKHFFVGMNDEVTPDYWTKAKIDFDALSTHSSNTVKRLLELSRPGMSPGSEFFGDSVYNALQTVTYFVDHEQRTRGESSRWASASMGAGANLKDEAFALANSLVA